MTALAWQSAITSGGFLSGSLIQGLLVLNYPDKTFHPYQVTLLGYSCLLIAVFVNTVIVELLPSIESIMLIIHIIGFFVVMIIISYMAPHSSAVDVFTVFSNGGGWPTQGLSVMVGLIGNVFSFTGAYEYICLARDSMLTTLPGADAAVHVRVSELPMLLSSQETDGRRNTQPRRQHPSCDYW